MPLPLRYSQYRFTLHAGSPVVLGAFPLGTVRGALGGSLRAVACTTGAPTCRGCPLLESCAYGLLFESAPLSPHLHGGFADAPRPYVLHLPRPLPERAAPGQGLAFEVVLIESAAATLPALVRAARRLEHTGLGDRRERGEGRVRLLRVEAYHGQAATPVWEARGRALALPPAPVPLGAAPRPEGAPLELRFSTPLRLRASGETLAAPGLADVVRALARRVQALAALHGRLTDALRAELYACIDHARLLEAEGAAEGRFRPAVRHRYSARQRQRVPLEGVLGTLHVRAGWEPLWPLLDAGRLLHVGKNATHGLGQYSLHVAPVPNVTKPITA